MDSSSEHRHKNRSRSPQNSHHHRHSHRRAEERQSSRSRSPRREHRHRRSHRDDHDSRSQYDDQGSRAHQASRSPKRESHHRRQHNSTERSTDASNAHDSKKHPHAAHVMPAIQSAASVSRMTAPPRPLPRGISEISSEDFHRKATQFRVWLKQLHNLHLFDLPKDDAKRMFSDFVSMWNSGNLASELYTDDALVVDAPRTAHTWSFAFSGESERDRLRTVGKTVSALTNSGSSSDSAANPGPSGLPYVATSMRPTGTSIVAPFANTRTGGGATAAMLPVRSGIVGPALPPGMVGPSLPPGML
jgi:hypothetical protein